MGQVGKKKISEEMVASAFRQIAYGSSMRSIALGLGVHPNSLKERLIRLYGRENYDLAISGNNSLVVLAENIRAIKSPRKREEAESWLEANFDRLLKLDQEFDGVLFSEKKMRTRSMKENYHGLELDKFKLKGMWSNERGNYKAA